MRSEPGGRRSAWRGYRRGPFKADLSAAFMVSVLLIPQSLAYAMLAGLPPQVGLYASLLPLLFYAVLGSSPFLGIGPVAVLALMIAQTLGQAGPGVSPTEAALVLAAEVGLLMALAAVLRLDALASLLSRPVLHGFETGATLTIAASQLPILLGSPVQGSNLLELAEGLAETGADWHAPSAVYGLAAVSLLLLARRLGLRLAPFFILLLAMLIAMSTDAVSVGVRVVGTLPPLHMVLSMPRLQAELWVNLFPGALLVALMGYVSSLAVAESLGRRAHQHVNARHELRGLAAANLAAAFSGGMPVAASFSRSALMFDAGSRSRMSGVFIAFFMGLALWILAVPLAWLPKAVLAASILVAVLSGLNFRPYWQAWRYAPAEGALMLAVTLLLLFWSVAAALGLGVVASIALLLQRTAQPHVALIGRVPETEHYRNVERHHVECLPEVMGLRIDESLLFINVRSLSDVVQTHLRQHPHTQRIVMMMSPVNAIDYSGLEALHELHDALARQGVRLDLSEVKGPVLDRLTASGWQRWFKGRVFLSHHQGMAAD